MIVLFHNNKRVLKVVSKENILLPFDEKSSIASVAMKLAIQYSKSKIVWCHTDYEDYINLQEIEQCMHHDKMMLSYNPQVDFLGTKIGYVEESPFIKINKQVIYPTWQMSSIVGIIHASLLLAVNNQIKLDSNFDYFLNSLAKVCMPLGLLCYSEPKLLHENSFKVNFKPSNFLLYKFVKQHYRTRWVFLLFFNMLIYEAKFPIFALLNSCFFKNRNKNNISLNEILVSSKLKIIDSGTIDVIIPTIGREKYLYDVLRDLAQQSYLPLNVIIVEQNPIEDSFSQLDYLTSESWPFKIKHTFTHTAGACNARNVALNQVESEWVFLNDDDNRFDHNLIENTFKSIQQYGCSAALTFYPNVGEKLMEKDICQASIFGSGNSFLKSAILQKVSFNKSLEFGYGEDAEFGLQLRNNGSDIIYFPNLIINHLKAPIGGFRTKPFLAWQNEEIQPKPSPTIMYLKLNNQRQEQIWGYKTMFFFKYYKAQEIKNPIKYFVEFTKQWKASVFWANQLKK